MPFIALNSINQVEKIPGYRVRFVHSQNMTLAYWDITAGAPLPEHSHPHEQVANILAGKFELTIAGESRLLDAGSVAIIPGGAVHSGRAITDCRILDVFYPVREEYR